MGCDGGTIPTRDELVRVKKKPEQKDRDSELAFKWKHCAISQEALVKPVVACELGRLYNKETVLEFLLDKSKFEVEGQFDHIRGLRDIKELVLTDNPDTKQNNGAVKGDGNFIDTSRSDYICPVVGIGMSGKYRFSFIWTCGCVMSERALKKVKSEVCHKCERPYRQEDVIVLNGAEEDVELLQRRMEERRAAAKAAKKSKKSSKHKLADSETNGTFKKPCIETAPSTSKTSSVSTNGMSIQTGTSGASGSKIKVGSSKVGKLVDTKLNGKGKLSDERKVGSSKTIQNDSKASKTYKSLFTTCEAEKHQKSAHWVTYNPFYN